MSKQVKTVKVSAESTRGFWIRPLYRKSMEKTIEEWVKKGWTLSSTTPLNGRGGSTTHYILTFEKE